MTNYHTQDGCWSCKHFDENIAPPPYDSLPVAWKPVCLLTKRKRAGEIVFHFVEPYGLCDLYQKEEKMKNYRVQDGCWNCRHHTEDIGHDYEYYFCGIDEPDSPKDVLLQGICDLYEKEAQ